jgi:hypothetical protein
MNIQAAAAGFVKSLQTRLDSYRMVFSDERTLQNHLESIFNEEKMIFWREHSLGPADIVDFYFQGGYAVEVKVGGAVHKHLHQLKRYADHNDVIAVVLVATRPFDVPEKLSNKPCFCINVGNARL